MSTVLSEEQVEAVTAGLLAGVPVAELLSVLAEDGVDPQAAWPEVAAVVRSPILAGARGVAVRSAALERAARLHLALDPGPVPERSTLDEDALHREHWIPQRPVVLRGGAAGWPALGWTFPALRDRFRWAPVDVVARTPGWWRRDRVLRRMPFGELVDAVLGPPTDALYADGYASVLEQAGLAPLRAELGLLPGLVGDGHPRAWVGPAGTVTPTHTDQSCGWLTQLVGRKRVFLASPLEPALLDRAYGLFAQVDPRDPREGALAEVRWHEVVLGPGDALFTPVGWWHHVEALDPSFSVSFSGFRWPNAFPWFVPG